MNWEPVPIDSSGQFAVWVWFRPVALPIGLMLSIPAALFSVAPIVPRLSVRQLVYGVGLDPGQILGWSVGGMSFDSAGGTSPYLDQILPVPSTDALEVSVWMAFTAPSAGFVMPLPTAGIPATAGGQPASPASTPSTVDSQLLDAIDSCWNGVMQLEVRVGTIRKELGSVIARLNSINRDLNSDERRFCDSNDIQDWSDARRWLRDSILVLSKCVKEIDVGTTSNAGKRNSFNEIYRNHVVPRIPFAGLQQAANEFDTYRKVLQSVVASAQASLGRAGREAESRANSVLQKINMKVRTRRRKI